MPKLEEIQEVWELPDNWSIRVDDQMMEIIDTHGEAVAVALTQTSAIASIQNHLKKQDDLVAYKIMLATLKSPIEA